jgi:F-type H+-transporting ATPase subunit b
MMHEALEIPWKEVLVQAYNVVLLFALLIYLLRKVVIEHFKSRGQTYTELVERAEAAKTAAEKSHREISQKLNELQKSADENLRNAKTEAESMKQKLMAEAQILSKKLEEDAHRSVGFEIEKAKSELRDQLLADAVTASREALKKTVGSTESKRLQTEFADKIQVVGQ